MAPQNCQRLRPGRRVASIAALTLGVALAGPAFSIERHHLGFVETGGTVTVTLPVPVPAASLVVELDGAQNTQIVQFSGRQLVLRLPDDLQGQRHDLVISQMVGGEPKVLGSWEFELSDVSGSGTLALQGSVGVVTDGQQFEVVETGGGRVDFDMSGGRISGAASFTLLDKPDPDTGSRWSLDAFELKSRSALFGDELTLRLGSIRHPSETALWDGSARRGVSGQLSDLVGRYDATVFAQQVSVASGPDNLTGLGEADDRVIGATASVQPDAGSGLTLSANAYSGRAPELPLAQSSGDAWGIGGAVSLPIGDADILVRLDQTEFTEAGATRRGQSRYAEMNLSLPELGDRFSQSVTAEYEWIDVDFHAPLNPDLIVGEERVTLRYGAFDPEWDVSVSGTVAHTNAGGPTSAPVDRLLEVTADLSYAPDIFTGGLLRGSTFYLGGSMLRQDRVTTPSSAGAAQDHTIWQVAAGVGRFEESSSVSLLYTYDKIDIRSPGANDQTIHTMVGLGNVKVDEGIRVSASGLARNTRGGGTDFWNVEGGASLTYALVPNRLDYDISAGGAWFEDPAQEDYYFVDQALAWNFNDNLSLVLSADYRQGQSTQRVLPGDGWLFGLSLQSQFVGAFN